MYVQHSFMSNNFLFVKQYPICVDFVKSINKKIMIFLFNVSDLSERNYNPYNRGSTWNQSGDPYSNNNREKTYDETKTYDGSYGSGYEGSYGDRGTGRGLEGASQYGRDRYPSKNAGLDDGGGRYAIFPVPGDTRNCSGSGCCAPKCYAEKGSRVRILENIKNK